jgi:hypothetical protein
MTNTSTKQKHSSQYIITLSIKIYLAIFLALILVWGINLGWHFFDLYSLARQLQNDPGSIESMDIIPQIKTASGDISTIYGELKPLFPFFNALQKMPWIGQYLGQVEPLLTYANGISQAGNEIVLGITPLLDDTQPAQSGLSVPEHVFQVLQEGQAHFITATQSIDQAGLIRSRIHPELLPDAARSLYNKLDSQFDLLTAGAQFLQSAPVLLGEDSAQSYLILAQNRDELRATGGFISGIGMLTLQDGKITHFNLGDSYAIDDFSKPYPPPPEPLKRFMLAGYWVTRDANWSPDFPIAARQAQSLFQLSTGTESQGVIAFNQLAIQSVLKVIGPIQVPGTDEPVTAENVENYMRQAWAPAPQEGLSDAWWQHRKDFMLQLGSVILDKVLGSPDQQQMLSLARAIKSLLDQGQLLVYFNDTASQQALQVAGWDGALHPGNADYLYLVDSNVGFNKVDSVIQRSINYQVDLSDIKDPTAKVTLSYQNTGTGDVPCKQVASYGNGTYQDMQLRCYWDYWRVYTPSGAVLLTPDTQPVPAEALLNGQAWSGQVETPAGEGDTQVFAGLLMLPLSQASQTTLSYELPLKILQPKDLSYLEYSLNVQVQPGLAGIPFQIQLKLPDHAIISNPANGWGSDSTGIWTWQGYLNQPITLELTFEIKP